MVAYNKEVSKATAPVGFTFPSGSTRFLFCKSLPPSKSATNRKNCVKNGFFWHSGPSGVAGFSPVVCRGAVQRSGRCVGSSGCRCFCGKKREGSTWLTFFYRRYIFKLLFFVFPVSSSMERHLADKGVLGDKWKEALVDLQNHSANTSSTAVRPFLKYSQAWPQQKLNMDTNHNHVSFSKSIILLGIGCLMFCVLCFQSILGWPGYPWHSTESMLSFFDAMVLNIGEFHLSCCTGISSSEIPPQLFDRIH